MKQITLINKKKLPITDQEAEKICVAIEQGAKFIRINTEMINVNSISIIGEVDTIKYWDGYRLNADGASFMRDGQRIYLDGHNFAQIKEVPIFEEIPETSLEQLEDTNLIKEKN